MEKNTQIKAKKYNKKTSKKKSKSFKIFVGGLPSHTTRQMLEKYFKTFGNVKNCQPKMWKNNTKRCKGFAIIILGDKKTYKKILELETHIFSGREIECKEVLTRNELDNYSKNLSERKVYVRGISLKTEAEGLKEAFSQFGEVEMAYVVKDRQSGISLGFGYVTFIKKESRDLVLKNRNFIVEGKVVVCYEYDNRKYEEKNAVEEKRSGKKRKGRIEVWEKKESGDEVEGFDDDIREGEACFILLLDDIFFLIL